VDLGSLNIHWERADGWPRFAAGFCLLVSLAFLAAGEFWSRTLAHIPSGWIMLALLSALLALGLLSWRRTMRIAEGALYQGWGLKIGPTLWQVRESSFALPSLEAIWVEERPEHFKAWTRMFAVVVGVPRSLQRAVVDDEFHDRSSAERRATWLSGALQVPFSNAGA
jgi:hypothetical protein